jgi:FKBP-type peptidyl-prolyl cis-trans isomerase
MIKIVNILVVLLFLFSCNSADNQVFVQIDKNKNEEELLQDYLKLNNVKVEPLISGLYVIEIKKGDGDYPIPTKQVKVLYKGYLIDGSLFDKSHIKTPLEFSFGVGKVIRGWDEGISKMREGGEYRLIIPSYLAYGNLGYGNIQPNATLIFDMKLLEVEK